MDEVEIIRIQIPCDTYEKQMTRLIDALLKLDEEMVQDKTKLVDKDQDQSLKEAA